MSLNIQDPSYSKSAYLHEALISSCVGKKIGGGAYAFASKNGIELLIEDDNFKQFLKNGSFLLIIGMDDITNIYSIDTLMKLQEKYEGHLKVKAYIHNSKGSTFHPKYSWFANDDGGVLLDAAKGLDYPSGSERPLGVFVKVSPRDFIYELVTPSDARMDKVIEGEKGGISSMVGWNGGGTYDYVEWN